MTKLKFTFLTLVLCFLSFGQTKNYSEKEILETQRITTAKIIVGLQNDEIESILQYIDKSNNNIKTELNNSISEIKKLINHTTLSDVVVFDEGYHIFRCRYSDKTRARFQIDIYFHTKNPNSKVVKVKIKADQTLKKEYLERINSREIPPASPKSNRK
ncbi:hypothetical protein [Winogradskyella poriferorum]|uniref:hypothetical protein n=1 Tax=Winogradskyella poriferorum TaxID=307627 RepID=UPI003D651CB3